jgi:hypothetical protein
MLHLQPNEDTQFNRVSRGVMQLGQYTRGYTRPHFFHAAYKNAWLKSEATTVVANTTTTETPQYYIMIQSMFDAAAKTPVQVIGIRQNNRFEFYRQRVRGTTTVDHLAWRGWYSFLPYRSY